MVKVIDYIWKADVGKEILQIKDLYIVFNLSLPFVI